MSKIMSLGREQFLGKLRKSGNSIVVSIPSEVQTRLNVDKDETVLVTLDKIPERQLDELRTKINAEKRYDKKATGRLISPTEEILAEIGSLYYSIEETTIGSNTEITDDGLKFYDEMKYKRAKFVEGVILSSNPNDEDRIKEQAYNCMIEIDEDDESTINAMIVRIDEAKNQQYGEGNNYLERKVFYGQIIEGK